MGLAFCAGVMLFFACLAGANIILQVVYDTVLQWGDQFRNPAFCRRYGDADGGACVIYVRPVYDYCPLVDIGQKRLRQRIWRRGWDGFSGGDTQHALQFRDIGGGVRLGAGAAAGPGDTCDNGNRNRYGGAICDINRYTMRY